MAKFLDAEELYRLFQRELPESLYPDGSPSGSFSAASVYAKAQTYETLYSNLERIYINNYPQDADERIADWETKVFGKLSTLSSLAERQSALLQKLRHIPTLATWEILTLVAQAIPIGKYVQVVPWGCAGMDGGNWQLGVSELGINTALGFGSLSSVGLQTSSDLCHDLLPDGWRLGVSQLGVDTILRGSFSWQDISDVQAVAYTYEVRIFDYTLPALDYEVLVENLAATEPARSGRVIRQNLDPATFGLIVPVTDVDQFSGVNCITRDTLSTTGYSGLIKP